MMWCPRRRTLVCSLIIACGVLAAGIAQVPMEDLRIPLEHYSSGALKAELIAKKAEVPPDGRIVAYGLTMRSLYEDGSLEMEIQAEDCECDRVEQVAQSTNHVTLIRGDIRLDGDGFVWQGNEEKITILRNARVSFPSSIVKSERIEDRVKN